MATNAGSERRVSDPEVSVVGGRIFCRPRRAGPQWLVAMRGLPISRGKLYPGYRLFRRLRFVVGGNRRERSSNERVARPLDAPLVFARRRFIEILFLWPAKARASARRGAARRGADVAPSERREMSERTTGPKETRESPLLLISSAFLHPFPYPCVSLYLPLSHSSHLSLPHRGVSRSLANAISTLFRPRLARVRARARVLALTGNLARPRSRFLAAARLIYALRPFNSIATPFYNAAAPVQRKRKSRWLLTLRLTRQRAISRDPT